MSHLDYNLNRENRGEKYVKIVQDLKKNINDVRHNLSTDSDMYSVILKQNCWHHLLILKRQSSPYNQWINIPVKFSY